MVPLKLEVRNFLSYGDAPVVVNFQHHSLICLSGRNGNGKSALLDAMTWALWGQARKVAGAVKADEGLLRLGQTRMMVAFEFLCNKQRYRVRREFAKTYGKPIAALHFDLFDSKKKAFMPLTEKTVRKTQARIEATIGIDFDTFINSAFLRQGHSNEFSKKTPKERKQILANILGLARYDELSKLALENARTYNNEQKVLVKLSEKNIPVLEQESAIKKDFFEKKKQLRTIDKKLVTLEKKEQKILKVQYEYEQLEKTIAEKKSELKKLVATWRKTHAKSLALPDITMLEQKRKKLLQQERELREKQQHAIELQEKILVQKNAYQETLSKLCTAYDQKLQKDIISCEKAELAQKQLLEQQYIAEKNSKRKKLEEAKKKLEIVEKDLGGYETFKKECEVVKTQFEKRRVFYQALVQRGNIAQKDFHDLEQKKALVQDKENPSCPLCEQVLTMKRKQFLSRAFLSQKSFLMHRISRIKQLLKSLKLILFEQHASVQKMSLQDEQYKQLVANKELLCKTIAELAAECQREEVEANLLAMRIKKGQEKFLALQKVCDEKRTQRNASIESDKKIISLKKILKFLEKDFSTIAYDKKNHESIQKELQKIEKDMAEFDEMKTELSRQSERRKDVTTVCAAIKKLQKTFSTLKDSVKDLAGLGKGELLKTKAHMLQELGRLENKTQQIEAIKKEERAREGEMKCLIEQTKEYQELAKMFGRDGIQALLIEEVIPEIEQEANRLLSKLTDNKSQIFIESLRDLKKGGVKESLDIHISDASGIRPYEMFSGGEAFRIDFSLRIAISKLLARRAGTALQTLIIDEGFGSQDEEGLQRLMDAILAIQKDFSRIIVVSHLHALKDSFPVHFVIQKGTLGSVVRVEERG